MKTIRQLVAMKLNDICTSLAEATQDEGLEKGNYRVAKLANGKSIYLSDEAILFGYYNYDTSNEHPEVKFLLDRKLEEIAEDILRY